MSLKIGKSPVLNDGTIQIEMKNNDAQPYYFRVSQDKADAFISESKSFDKKASQIKIGAIITGILGGTFAAHFFTKKMDNNLFKYLINSAAGISGAMLMDSICGEYLSSEHNKIKNKYNVI